jgi:predicted methyltransferase
MGVLLQHRRGTRAWIRYCAEGGMRICLQRRVGLLLLVVTTLATTQAQNDAADVALLLEVLGVHPGAVVADIGAGDGVLTIPIAREVGPDGRVYATELGGASIKRLSAALTNAAVTNVEVVEGDPARTNLPPACCESIFIRNVYHHFANPKAMNASLSESLKPGGTLAILDFAPNGPEATSPTNRASGKTHGVAAETVMRELREAGFDPIKLEQRQDKTFLVVVRKPDAR